MTTVLGYLIVAAVIALLTYRQVCVLRYEQGKRAAKPEDLFS